MNTPDFQAPDATPNEADREQANASGPAPLSVGGERKQTGSVPLVDLYLIVERMILQARRMELRHAESSNKRLQHFNVGKTAGLVDLWREVEREYSEAAPAITDPQPSGPMLPEPPTEIGAGSAYRPSSHARKGDIE